MDSAGEELHPNWRALATIHLPLKRFVREGDEFAEKGVIPKKKFQIEGVTGTEVQEFYEQIVLTAPTSQNVRTEKPRRIDKRSREHFQPFEQSKYFNYATSNNVTELKKMKISADNMDTRDLYGWTALMMASCEGAVDSAAWLCKLGVDKYAKDKAGNTATDLARKKGHLAIVCLLEDQLSVSDDRQKNRVTEPLEPFYCSTCKRSFTETTKRSHQTSTVHQFNERSNVPANKLNKFNISVKNRGLQLMVKQGWDREHGLGPTQSGRLYPVKTVLRKSRTGIGIVQPAARVTHFDAFDIRATQRRSPLQQQRQPTRDEMKREKFREWKQNRRLRRELT